MPEQITKYRVFIASPSDLVEDRQAIDEVVEELNLTYSLQHNLIIELVKWETHSAPGISRNHVQGLINNDIGSNYDIFIGLLWLKFGSKTDNANSGTEEEFNIAHDRFKESPDTLQILFYFKTTPPKSIEEINTDELCKINKFREKIGGEGVLYWRYNTVEELQSFLRIHIPKRISGLKTNENIKTNQSLIKANTNIEENVEKIALIEELGILDFQELVEIGFSNSMHSTNNITNATIWIGERINEKTAEINRYKQVNNQIGNKDLRRICRQSAQVMNEYASRLNVEIPIFFENFEIGIKAISSMINIADDFYDISNYIELETIKDSAIEMNSGIKFALNGTIEFYNTIVGLPRMEKELNQAKKNVALKLDELNKRLTTGSELSVELVKEISAKIDRIKYNFC